MYYTLVFSYVITQPTGTNKIMNMRYCAILALCIVSTSYSMQTGDHHTTHPSTKDTVQDANKEFIATQIVRLQTAIAQQDYEYYSNNFFGNPYTN